MIFFLISLALATLSWWLSILIFDSYWTGILPFVIVLTLSMFFLGRFLSKRLAALTQRAQVAMQAVPAVKSEQAREQFIEKAINILKGGYAYRHFQFFLKAQLDAQIGALYYVQKKFKEAEPYLENAFYQQGSALAMYACHLYRRKDYDKMKKRFERLLKHHSKVPLFWNVYAWCLLQNKERDAAIEVMHRCLAVNPKDEISKDNLNLLQNNGKMRMRVYQEQWYQFHLESPPQQKVQVQDPRMLYGKRR